MAIPDWTKADADGSSSWEVLTLAGIRVPGISLVDSKLPSSLDKRKPKNSKKAQIVDMGEQPIEFRIRVTLMNSNELSEFNQQIMPILHQRQKGKKQQEIDIGHPQARLWGVGKVLIMDVEIPTPPAGGALVIMINAIESKPPQSTRALQNQPQDTNEGWNNVDGMTRALKEDRPSRSGQAAKNF